MAGPSAAGKSTPATRLAAAMEKPVKPRRGEEDEKPQALFVADHIVSADLVLGQGD